MSRTNRLAAARSSTSRDRSLPPALGGGHRASAAEPRATPA
ncbi:hypothetical protein [Ornithinimicrobium kibberense]